MANVGYKLPAGKGYHFADGPYVEYAAAVPADAIEPLRTKLQVRPEHYFGSQ